MNLDSFKLNNYVQYVGKLAGYYGQKGQITSVDKGLNGEDNYQITINHFPNNEPTQIRAYKGEITGIPIDKEFLEKQGFVFETQNNQFDNGALRICRPAFIKVTTDFLGRPNTTLVDKGFRVIKNNIFDYANEDEVMEKTYGVHMINAYQNFYESILNSSIEIKW